MEALKQAEEFGNSNLQESKFDWCRDDEDIVITHSPGIAVYQNADANVVVRQHAGQGDHEDQFVVIRREDARQVAKAIVEAAR